MLDIKLIQNALKSLSIYRNLLDDPVVQAYLDHLSTLARPHQDKHPAHTYGYFFHLLAQTSNPMADTDAMQNYLLDLILDDINPFSQSAASPGTGYKVFLPAAARDLAILQLLFKIKADFLREATMKALSLHPLLPHHLEPLPLLTAKPALKKQVNSPQMIQRLQLKKEMATQPHWDQLAKNLADYYAQWGCGPSGRYIAFKWGNQHLQGVEQPDPITLDQLIGYEDIRQKIIHNTLQFLHGFPANNMLLYGDRGTGKSSTIKALLNQYWPQGLRLVEVSQELLVEFPAIIQKLQYRRHKFILFVDDLSFEEGETSYKNLKSLLEGGVASRPDNVLVYATSNRRHLIRETFNDRDADSTEVHSMDSVQEKLSLSDRFGITVIFPTPDQELFLSIVSGLAQQRKIPISQAKLHQRALQWASWNNGRSPRSARQFIDQLEGEIALQQLHS